MKNFDQLAPEPPETKTDPYLIGEVNYTADQSPDFDNYVRSKKVSYALQDSLNERTKTDLLVCEWQVPCHIILTRNPDGESQAFHVQPKKISTSLLTYEQKQALKTMGQQKASAIAIKGNRTWFATRDIRELEDMGINFQRTIDVDTYSRWRLMYDPTINQIWIDIKDKKSLKKYKGF